MYVTVKSWLWLACNIKLFGLIENAGFELVILLTLNVAFWAVIVTVWFIGVPTGGFSNLMVYGSNSNFAIEEIGDWYVVFVLRLLGEF